MPVKTGIQEGRILYALTQIPIWQAIHPNDAASETTTTHYMSSDCG